ncbi:ribonuclease P protein component [Cloacibacillus porcorum]|uniref:ribonuclease P protein component n=1 Tax=Cloacibacillus porcorum TaxID=1197717 RepID=UPI0023567BEC|nr:ribonuclease P protein component [Cloacibacillus porcorum]MCD7876051.1 ribonuclease P protein component [Cloacibacillus porcorum]MCD8234488.1 ribonuclease P protein component [Cloacibacillus porcorum]MCD8392302.1 ribonuclease P protein component [Cloacibacillus porcorum]MCI5865154.1 ribonuclease P protein component [Cloacibacillus porcorum]
MDFGFSSAKRLKSGWQFDLVFRTGRRETGALVRLLFLTKAEGPALVGVTVGKKIAGAARRTRGRRVMRESFRRLLPWIKEGTWIVASLRENALGAKADEVYADMALSLKRRGLLKAEWPGADWNVDCRDD